MIEAILIRLILYVLLQTLAILSLVSPDIAAEFLHQVEEHLQRAVKNS